ncbi:hypothetical protein scyTo_0007166 [Scyliorhinus torazame]|uniref:Uncharacterized protein n=1 Tax=Scyliorhinus torazame TaxID=75743 RepID=A0A401NMN5_SCYTO|nr:hypothetical protein [Scyliorhinus torazame]
MPVDPVGYQKERICRDLPSVHSKSESDQSSPERRSAQAQLYVANWACAVLTSAGACVAWLQQQLEGGHFNSAIAVKRPLAVRVFEDPDFTAEILNQTSDQN